MAIPTPKREPHDPALPPPPPRPQEDEHTKREREKALKELGEYQRAIAWPVGRWPVAKHVVQTRTRVHLPRTYRARAGSDVRSVWPGTDLNLFVHGWYSGEGGEEDGERKGEGETKGKEGAWANYVAEGIRARRHEYLGPDPRVAGYFMDAQGEYHIKWYDTFLGDQWMDGGVWRLELRRDERGRWVDVDDP